MVRAVDKELIQRAKEGDKAAYKELFMKYSKEVLSYLYRYVGDYQKAEEILVDTFLDVYDRLPYYREEGKFLSWVYKIATNFARKEFRRRKRQKEVILDMPIDEGQKGGEGTLLQDSQLRPDHKLIQDELHNAIDDIISKLDEKYRSAITLCDLNGLSYEEAAYVLRSNKGTVGSSLSRARKLLQQELKRRGYDV